MGRKQPITPVKKSINARIKPPGSKSITNRALLLAAMARGTSHLTGVLDSEDTQVMIEALIRCGFTVNHDLQQKTATVTGATRSTSEKQILLDCKNSGTSIRFLTAALAALGGNYLLDGTQRMRERPIADLVTALRGLGADVSLPKDTGCPPVLIRSHGLSGGDISVPSEKSSQFLSGLLMAAPLSRNSVLLKTSDDLVSRPYVDMTLAMMKSFGHTANCPDPNLFPIQPGTYQACTYDIEPDASAASYHFATAAVCGGKITVEGLNFHCLQSDIGFVRALEQMGCVVEATDHSISVIGRELHGIDIDMNQMSDTAQTLAVVALFAKGPTRIRGVAHNRFKETDRIANLAIELRKLGAEVKEFSDGLEVHPKKLSGCEITTYQDHRMAMSLSIAGLRVAGVIIDDPDCVQKTYPEYFADLAKICS